MAVEQQTSPGTLISNHPPMHKCAKLSLSPCPSHGKAACYFPAAREHDLRWACARCLLISHEILQPGFPAGIFHCGGNRMRSAFTLSLTQLLSSWSSGTQQHKKQRSGLMLREEGSSLCFYLRRRRTSVCAEKYCSTYGRATFLRHQLCLTLSEVILGNGPGH